MPVLDTEFLFALNPRDRHHSEAKGLLRALARKEVTDVVVPDVALLEFVVTMKSHGFTEEEIKRALLAIKRILLDYRIPVLHALDIDTLVDALSYTNGFFDRLIAAAARRHDSVVISNDNIFDALGVMRIPLSSFGSAEPKRA